MHTRTRFRRRGAAATAALAAFAIGLSGCTGGSANGTSGSGAVNLDVPEKKSGHLVFLEKWPSPQYAPYFEKVVADYEKANPDVTIDLQAVGDQPYKDKIKVLTSAKKLPDIYFSWAGDYANKFVRGNLAADLSPVLGPGTEWGKRFAPAALEAFNHDGKQYGVPINLDAKVFVYNQKAFADAKVKEPTSFDELLKTCDALDRAGYTPIAFGNKHGWPAIHYMTQLNAQWVPREVRDTDYRPSGGKFTDPGYVRALENLQELGSRCFTGQANGVAHESAQATMFQGESAMQFVETFEFPLLSAKDVPEDFKDNWSFFRMPPIPGAPGDQNALVGAPDGLLVNPQSKNAGLAVDFLKFFTSVQNASLMTEMNDWLSPVQGSADSASPQNQEALKTISGAEHFAVWLDTVTHTKVAQAYLSGVEGLLDDSLTPEEVMAKVREAAKQARAEVGS